MTTKMIIRWIIAGLGAISVAWVVTEAWFGSPKERNQLHQAALVVAGFIAMTVVAGMAGLLIFGIPK